MKIKGSVILLFVAAMILFSACSMRDVGDAVEDRIDQVEDKVEGKEESTNKPVETNQETVQPTDHSDGENEGEITKEEAQTIALNHAGFTAEAVTEMYTEYELDNGVPEYEVEFYKDGWEYDYTIHAQNGNVISVDKEQKDTH